MTPQYIEAGGIRIAFTAATQIERSLPPDTKEATETDPGVLRTLDPEKYLEVIREADANADFTIAFVHWGSENVFEYEAAQRELAEAYAEAGADLIIGAHPHVLQGFDYVGEVPVIYSMGNFWFNSKTMDSCMIEAVISENGVDSLRFIPCVQHGCYTSMKHEGDGEFERIIDDQIRRSTDAVSLSANGIITRAVN
jgi:poly-gamma-glutamate synthesis protein (capsule biosynthesis protein)